MIKKKEEENALTFDATIIKRLQCKISIHASL